MKLFAATALAVSLAIPAYAQQCAPREDVARQLFDKYNEVPHAMALSQAGVVEVFASLDSGTWTIVITDTTGKTCLVGSGTDYTPVSPKAPEEPA